MCMGLSVDVGVVVSLYVCMCACVCWESNDTTLQHTATHCNTLQHTATHSVCWESNDMALYVCMRVGYVIIWPSMYTQT